MPKMPDHVPPMRPHKETPMERHNRLTTEFTHNIIGDVLRNGGNFSDVMMIIESVILSTMIMNQKIFKMEPAVSSGLVETAVQQAIKRFTESNNPTPSH